MTRGGDERRSAASRPLKLRMRPDLVTQQRIIGNQRRWLIRDPLTLANFQLADEEFSLLNMLDGQISIEQLRSEFERAFAPKRLSVARLLAWVGKLHRDGLLLTDAPGEAERLLIQGQRLRHGEFTGQLMNILAIRFRGVDPDRFLDRLHRIAWPLFTTWSIAISSLLALFALLLVAIHLDVVYARLPELDRILQGSNLVCLWIVLAGTKVIHELAHGLACKHYGGECHELGVMLLVFTPCLYCDVSDAWSIPSRWKRMAISAAGIYAELILASVAAILWWFSRPGLLNTICLDVMLVCGVSTLIFNGNPLLRYDGYFILSDFVNVPNLWRRSRDVLRETVGSWFVDDRRAAADSLDDGRRSGLLLYAVASTCYRWCVLVVILLFLLTVLKPYGLQAIGQILACTVLMGLTIVPASRSLHALTRPTAPRIRKRRVFGTMLCVIAVLLLGCFVPLPCRIAAPILLQPHAPQRLYVSAAGTIVESVAVGDRVEKGQVIARLDNSELQRELAELSGEFAEREARLASLEAMRLHDPAAGQRIPEATKALANAQQRLAQRSEDLERLELRAARDGVVMAPAAVEAGSHDRRELPSWSGIPLDEANRGSFLEAGTLVCLIGDAHEFDAIAFVDAASIRFIRPGQQSRILVVNHPGKSVKCVVETIAKAELSGVPRELSKLIDLKPSSAGDAPVEARHTVYQVRLRLEETQIPLVDRMTGRARIHVSPQSLGRRIARYLSRTFTFELEL